MSGKVLKENTISGVGKIPKSTPANLKCAEPDQNSRRLQAVPVCQQLNKVKADPQNTEGRRPAVLTQTSSKRLEGENGEAQGVQGSFRQHSDSLFLAV